MGRLFARTYSPSTLGSFLRSFPFGHVRQLDAVASRFLAGLAARSSVGRRWLVLVDVDDTIIEVHGYAKQGSGFGYSGVRGLNALLATVAPAESAPVWWRNGSAGARDPGARRERLVADALKTVARVTSGRSGLLGRLSVLRPRHHCAAARAGADVSVTVN